MPKYYYIKSDQKIIHIYVYTHKTTQSIEKHEREWALGGGVRAREIRELI